MHELSSATRLLIVKMAVGRGEQRQDVADKFNVKLQVVQDLIKDFNKSQQLIIKKR